MTSRLSRVLLTLLIAGSFAAIIASVAAACLEPQFYTGTTAAGPGDPVPFTITGTDPGAEYTVTVDGITVASGSDGDQAQGTGGSFQMPDLGAQPRTVYARMVTTHDGSEWPDEVAMQYQAPASVPPPAVEGSVPQPPVEQGVESGPAQQAQPPHQVPGGGGGPGHPAGEGSGHDAGAGPNVPAAGAPAGGAEVTTSVGAAVGVEEQSAQERSTARVATAGDRRAKDEGDALAVPDEVVDAISGALGGETDVGPAAVPSAFLLALAFLLGLGLGGLGMLILVGRKLGPDPGHVATEVAAGYREAEIEAELQEIISEERAKRMLEPSPELPRRSRVSAKV